MDVLERVAFVGRMMSGKTTARRILEGEEYLGLAFADRVKADAIQMLNGIEQQYRAEFLDYDPIVLTRAKLDEDKAFFRTFLQWLGTDYFRQYRRRPDHWIEMLSERIKTERAFGVRRFVVDDARFDNEVAALKALDFTIIRVQTPPDVWQARMLAKYGTAEDVTKMMGHGSELLADLLPADLTITNDGDIDKLRETLLDVIGMPAHA